MIFTIWPYFSFALLYRYSKWMLIDNLRRKGSRTAATKTKKRDTRYFVFNVSAILCDEFVIFNSERLFVANKLQCMGREWFLYHNSNRSCPRRGTPYFSMRGSVSIFGVRDIAIKSNLGSVNYSFRKIQYLMSENYS